jgi:hypothetical protein
MTFFASERYAGFNALQMKGLQTQRKVNGKVDGRGGVCHCHHVMNAIHYTDHHDLTLQLVLRQSAHCLGHCATVSGMSFIARDMFHAARREAARTVRAILRNEPGLVPLAREWIRLGIEAGRNLNNITK